MKSKRKSSGTDLKTPKRKRSQEDSDADHEYTPKAAKKNVPKKSGTEMKCHKCEVYCSFSFIDFSTPLFSFGQTT